MTEAGMAYPPPRACGGAETTSWSKSSAGGMGGGTEGPEWGPNGAGERAAPLMAAILPSGSSAAADAGRPGCPRKGSLQRLGEATGAGLSKPRASGRGLQGGLGRGRPAVLHPLPPDDEGAGDVDGG